MSDSVLGLAISLGVVFLASGVVAVSRLPAPLKMLIVAALGLRVLGAIVRYWVLVGYYGGAGDAVRYYQEGLEYAEMFSRLDFSPIVDPSYWWTGRWWGTQFILYPSGLVLTLIGPTMLGEFIVFALFGFLGLVGFAVAFRRAHPDVPLDRYVRWIWLLPSLWFWPSSVGKEAIILMGIGLCVAGFVGKGGRIQWPLLGLGMFFVFAVRPQVASVVLLSLILAHWLGRQTEWSPARVMQGFAILVFGLYGIVAALGYLGIDNPDVEGVQGYMESTPARRVGGGSEIEAVEVGWRGVPLAIVNTLFRPFPWESRTVLILASSLEILLFWVVVWMRRRRVAEALRRWRSDRLLRLAIPFIIVYSISLGLVHTNLGIIARQRVFLFPFLFLLLEAAPVRSAGARLARALPRRHPTQHVPLRVGDA